MYNQRTEREHSFTLPLEIVDYILYNFTLSNWIRVYNLAPLGKFHRTKRKEEYIADRSNNLIVKGYSPFLCFKNVYTFRKRGKRHTRRLIETVHHSKELLRRAFCLISSIYRKHALTTLATCNYKMVKYFLFESETDFITNLRFEVRMALITSLPKRFLNKKLVKSLADKGMAREIALIFTFTNSPTNVLSRSRVTKDSVFCLFQPFLFETIPCTLSNKSVLNLYSLNLFPKKPQIKGLSESREKLINSPVDFCIKVHRQDIALRYFENVESKKIKIYTGAKILSFLSSQQVETLSKICREYASCVIKLENHLTLSETRRLLDTVSHYAADMYLYESGVFNLAERCLAFSFIKKVIASDYFTSSISLYTLSEIMYDIEKSKAKELLKRSTVCGNIRIVSRVVNFFNRKHIKRVVDGYISTLGVDLSSVEEYLDIIDEEGNQHVIIFFMSLLLERHDPKLALKMLRFKNTLSNLDCKYFITPSFYPYIKRLYSNILDKTNLISICKELGSVESSAILLLLFEGMYTDTCNIKVGALQCRNRPKKGSCCCGIHHSKILSHLERHGVPLV